MPLLVTLDPLECQNLIRHLNGTNKKVLNKFRYNKTFTLLEDHYFREQLERFQTFLLYINFTQCILVHLHSCLAIKPGFMIHSEIPCITVQLTTRL